MGLIAQFQSLNTVDLSGLQKRVTAITDQIEKALAKQGKTLKTATVAEVQTAASASGITADDLIDALATAKKRSQ